LIADPTSDSDNDGAKNLDEQLADTDPRSAASVLRFSSIARNGGNLVLGWHGGVNARQFIQRSASLSGEWTSIYTNHPPTALTNSLTIRAPANTPVYYRLRAE